MARTITLRINNVQKTFTVDPSTPLLYILRNEYKLCSPKYGCGLEQCGACKVLIDGDAVPTCQLPVMDVVDSEITTIESMSSDDQLHPIQVAFMEEQAAQCGMCTAGMMSAAIALKSQFENPSDNDIRQAMERHLCRCGVYDRVHRAIRSYFGTPVEQPNYEVIQMQSLTQSPWASDDLPRSIQNDPNLDRWISINSDGTITARSGKVELGQGIKTALAQIVAEELDVDISRIQLMTADTEQSANEGGTTGSMSVEMSGHALRVAAASARHTLIQLAFEELEAQSSISELVIKNGTITDPTTGRSITYAKLMGGKRFGQIITGQPPLKTQDSYQVVGDAHPRIDLRAKLTGQPVYVQDLVLPDMLHARVLRPPTYHARLAHLDNETLEALDGVLTIIQDGSFIGIVSENEAQVVSAYERAKTLAKWDYKDKLPHQETIYDDLMTTPAISNLIVDGVGVDAPIPEITSTNNAVQTLRASYRKPYTMHASLAPSAAIALWQDNKLTVWSHTQSVFTLRDSLAQVLKLPPEAIRVIHREGAGCYGHNGADDVALDAALIALRLPNRPISLKWMREQEHQWEPYGSAMAIETQASLDTNGKIISWNYDVWSYGHSTRPRGGGDTSGLLAAWHLEKSFEPQQPRPINGYHFGSHRNADPLYNLPHKRVVRHDVPNSPLRVSALRSLGAYANVFAIESFMDELATAAQIDPLQFRLNHLDDERAIAVLEAVAKKANWQSRDQYTEPDTGWGIAFSQYKNRQTYAAVIVKVHVEKETGKIRVLNGYIAADAGLIINVDGLSNQLEGGFVQAVSWSLYEAVRYDESGILSRDWETYPILRFPKAPIIETVLLNRPDQRSLGAGEATQNPTPAAIANAVYDTVGIRLCEIPFTPDSVLKLLNAQ